MEFERLRLVLIAANTLGFAIVGIWTLFRSAGKSEGMRWLLIALASIQLAIAMGGVQRTLLQATYQGLLPQSTTTFVLEDQASVQAITLLCIGLLSTVAIKRAGNSVETAERLLEAFGGAVGPVDWDSIGLTPRETAVVAAIASGILRDVDLGERLSISAETVRSHVKSILRKSGLRSRIEVAVSAHADPPLWLPAG